MNNQEELEDQPVGDYKEPHEGLTPTKHTVMTSGRVRKSQHIPSKKWVKLHSQLLNEIVFCSQ